MSDENYFNNITSNSYVNEHGLSVSWALSPDAYQPSGSLNYSRTRAFNVVHIRSNNEHIEPLNIEKWNEIQ
jgi:hypothetical protein